MPATEAGIAVPSLYLRVVLNFQESRKSTRRLPHAMIMSVMVDLAPHSQPVGKECSDPRMSVPARLGLKAATNVWPNLSVSRFPIESDSFSRPMRDKWLTVSMPIRATRLTMALYLLVKLQVWKAWISSCLSWSKRLWREHDSKYSILLEQSWLEPVVWAAS